MQKKLNFVVKVLRNILLIPVFFVISYLVPKQKKLILLGSNLGSRFIGNTKYLYLYLVEHDVKDLDYYWMTKNRKIYEKFKKQGLPVIFPYSLKGIWHVFRANYFVVEQSMQDVSGVAFTLGRFNVINLWHGVQIKKILFDNKDDQKGWFSYFMRKEWRQYKYIITKSKADIDFLKSGFRNESVVCLGYARDDILVKGEKKDIPSLDLSKYKTIFLYAPTFRDYYTDLVPFSESFLDKFNAFLKENNGIFLIKRHIADQNANRNIKLYKDYSNIVDITYSVDNLQEYLTSVDVLITDYSGIVFDFCLLNKPVIFYSYDYENYIDNCREMYYDYYQDMLGPFAKNEGELLRLATTLPEWFSNQEYQDKYKKFKDKFNYYQDGLSSQRLYNFIVKHL